MKRVILVGIGALAFAAGSFAQTPAGNFDAALAAAPANMRDGAMVIKWKADGSYDTLRPGTNRLMCYDQSGDAGEQPVSSQCTSVGNLERVKQNKIYEAKIADRTAREAALTELEKGGKRVKPEFGSVFYTRQGKDAATVRDARDDRRARRDRGIARHSGQQQDGRRLDHECGHVDRAHHDARTKR